MNQDFHKRNNGNQLSCSRSLRSLLSAVSNVQHRICKQMPRLQKHCTNSSRMLLYHLFGEEKGIEFCWECNESKTCEKWKKHRDAGKKIDSFKCYQTLEEDILFIQRNGIEKFEKTQKKKGQLLKEMLTNFNEGRSKSYYCIAATVLTIDELIEALALAKKQSNGLDVKEKSKILHSRLDDTASKKGYCLRLRK